MYEDDWSYKVVPNMASLLILVLETGLWLPVHLQKEPGLATSS